MSAHATTDRDDGAGLYAGSRRLVHLELHTRDLAPARDFYTALFGWTAERIDTEHGSYVGLDLEGEIGGGVVECPTTRALWLPYVEVESVAAETERARSLGATVLLEPREGPAGWRSVIRSASGGEVALWQERAAGAVR